MEKERLNHLQPKQELPKEPRVVTVKGEKEKGDCPQRYCEPVK